MLPQMPQVDMEVNFSQTFYILDKNSTASDSLHRETVEVEVDFDFKIVLCIIHLVLCLTALCGNSTILITIWKTPSLHSATNILLANLAVSDFAVGLITHPLFLTNLLTQISAATMSFSILTTGLCLSSFLTTTAIGVDRLLALHLHLRYKAVVTSFRVTAVITFFWVFSSIFAASMPFWDQNQFYYSLSVIFYILLVGNFVVYLKIYFVVRRHQTQIQHQQEPNNGTIFIVRRFKKSAVNTFLVYILLVCCYMPYCSMATAESVGASLSPSAYIASVIMALLNSSLNPFLYCWRVREIRTAMTQLFNC